MSAGEHTQSKHEEGPEEERLETWRFIVPVDASHTHLTRSCIIQLHYDTLCQE